MSRFARAVLIVSVLSLGGCASMDYPDPTEWFAFDWLTSKKKLPGERKPVFPEGVPGVAKGLPPELMRGNQPDAEALETRQATIPDEPKPKPKPKAKPKPAPKAATAEEQSRPTPVTVRPTDAPPQRQQQPPATQWPDPPQSQRQAPGQVQWPDPPPPTAFPR